MNSTHQSLSHLLINFPLEENNLAFKILRRIYGVTSFLRYPPVDFCFDFFKIKMVFASNENFGLEILTTQPFCSYALAY
jgi:hypothetical protein